MSITKHVITSNFLPSHDLKPSHMSKHRRSVYSSSNIVASYNQDRSFLWNNNSRRVKRDDKNRRRFVVRCVVPGAPPPQSPFNFINWIVGLFITVILPFITHKWTSLLKLKNEVETAVETVEDIVETVEKVAEGVEKVAEDIADDLPEGGALRRAVDFVEHMAERANRDAELVDDFIDKVQEMEEKVEGYFGSRSKQVTSHEKYVVYSGVEPEIPPPGPPPNILNWVVAVAITVVIPLVSYKWGPTLKDKFEMVMQKTEDVAEAVEKVAEKVEKVAEDIVDDLPEGGKLREAAEFVEKMAERTRIDAGAVDDFIDKVQGEEEKADESLNYESKIKLEDPKQNN